MQRSVIRWHSGIYIVYVYTHTHIYIIYIYIYIHAHWQFGHVLVALLKVEELSVVSDAALRKGGIAVYI